MLEYKVIEPVPASQIRTQLNGAAKEGFRLVQILYNPTVKAEPWILILVKDDPAQK